MIGVALSGRPVRLTGSATLEDMRVFPPKSWLLLLPHLQMYGGLYRFLYLARELERLGQQVVVGVKDFKGASNVVLHFAKENNLTLAPSGKIRKKSFDVVASGDASTPISRTIRRFKSSFYLTFQLAGGETYRREHEKIAKKAKPDLTISVSTSIHEDHVTPSKLIPGGVDLELFRPGGRSPIFDGKLNLATHYGRGKPFKGFLEALATAEGLRQVGVDARLHVVSSETVPEFNLPWVEPHIALTRERLSQLLSRCHGTLAFETRPGWGNFSAESVATGAYIFGNGVNSEDFLPRVARQFIDQGGSGGYPEALAGFILESGLNGSGMAPTDMTPFSWPTWSRRVVEAVYESM